ncbi:MAG: filamentous hemagglutinin N-terminal domain-containing protein [Cyanobacteria bacterium P01_G01_bin.54]
MVRAGVILSWAVSIVAIVLSTGAQALPLQPDGTLGNEHSVVTPIDAFNDRIDGGAARGANLFHSFQKFNVGEGRGVYFANPANISNILTRVTGGNISEIFGTLGVLGDANLWLINPTGIYFGPNARLDMTGSFTATTANGVWLGDDAIFSATDPASSTLLSISPGALFHNHLAAHQARIQSEAPLVTAGDLHLEAGNLELTGQVRAEGNLNLVGLEKVKIRDSDNVPFVASAGGNLLFQGNQIVDLFILNHNESGLVSGGNLTLRSDGDIIGDAHYFSYGNFRVEDLAGNLAPLLSPNDPIIRTSGDVAFSDYLGHSLHILAGGSVTVSGNISILGPGTGLMDSVTLSDGSSEPINGTTSGTVDIRAGTTNFGTPVSPSAGEGFTPDPPPLPGGAGSSADISISGFVNVNSDNGTILLTNQYFPNTTLAVVGGISASSLETSAGTGGKIVVDSRGDINIPGTIITSGSSGSGGNVILLTPNDITLPSTIHTKGTSVGGDVSIHSGGSINGSLFAINTGDFGSTNSTVFSALHGTLPPAFLLTSSNDLDSGTVELFAIESINLSQGIISASGHNNSGTGRGAGQEISLNSSGAIALDQVRLNSNSEFGNGEGISINSRTFSMLNESNLDINAEKLATQSGDITITAPDSVELTEDSLIALRVQNNSSGGAVILNPTKQLTLQDSLIATFANADSTPGGTAGTIQVAADRVDISGEFSGVGSVLGTSTFSGLANVSSRQGDSGGISVTAQQLNLFNGGSITATNAGDGLGGDISIDANSIFVGGAAPSQSFVSSITADSLDNGEGGNIQINADRLTLHEGITSTSSFGSGRAGEIRLSVVDLLLTGASTTPPVQAGLYGQSFNGSPAGSIFVSATNVDVQNEAKISVSSDPQAVGSSLLIDQANQRIDLINSNLALTTPPATSIPYVGRGTNNGDAGDINIFARERMNLRNQAEVVAETSSGQGGNINLDIGNILLMRYGSVISAEAGTAQAGGDGGNININSGFIISVPHENNDIIANAFNGNGGNITITTNGLYNIAFRDLLFPRNVITNDITASSNFGLNGTLTFNRISFPAEQGLNELPDSLVDAEDILSRDVCALRNDQIASGSSFGNINRGGIPVSPNDLTSANVSSPPWSSRPGLSQPQAIVIPRTHATDPLVRDKPAQGERAERDRLIGLMAETSGAEAGEPVSGYSACPAL